MRGKFLTYHFYLSVDPIRQEVFHLISQLSGDIKIAFNSSVGEVLLPMLGKPKTKLANDAMIKIWSITGCYVRYVYMFRKVRCLKRIEPVMIKFLHGNIDN